VSDETVRYFLGHYGETAAPVDPEIADKVLSRNQAKKLRDVEPVSLDGARERFGSRISDEELLLRLTMPEEQVDAMVASPPAAERSPSVGRPGRDPLVRLLREVESRKAISYMRLEKGDDLVVWRRAS
jgi:oxaloacetate decarboxylase alpha subunit